MDGLSQGGDVNSLGSYSPISPAFNGGSSVLMSQQQQFLPIGSSDAHNFGSSSIGSDNANQMQSFAGVQQQHQQMQQFQQATMSGLTNLQRQAARRSSSDFQQKNTPPSESSPQFQHQQFPSDDC